MKPASTTDTSAEYVRRTHRGSYRHATPKESAILVQAFPLSEALQHSADAFLKDRRRAFDPVRVRDSQAVRESLTLPLAKQVRHHALAPPRPAPAPTTP